MKMPQNEAETRAQIRRVELKLAAPVHCTDCNWTGKTGSLISSPQGSLRCPMCQGARIIWVEHPGTPVVQ